MLLRLVLSQTDPRIWLSPVTTGCPSTIPRLRGNSVCTVFFSEVMHGEYWVQREECQIVCINRKAKRYLDDFVMVCFLTDGRVLFGRGVSFSVRHAMLRIVVKLLWIMPWATKKFVSFTDQSFADVSQISDHVPDFMFLYKEGLYSVIKREVA